MKVAQVNRDQHIDPKLLLAPGDVLAVNETPDPRSTAQLTDIIWNAPSTGNNYEWYMSNTSKLGSATMLTGAVGWQMSGTGDFNRDGQLDILFREPIYGFNVIWYMTNSTQIGTASIEVADPSWDAVATGYFGEAADKTVDILWWNKVSGQVAIWLMDNTNLVTATLVTNNLGNVVTMPDLNWRIRGAGDFHSIGKTQILWYNINDGQIATWQMDGTQYLITDFWNTYNTSTNWSIAGAGYFNLDDKLDLLWREPTLETTIVWYLDGINYSSSGSFSGKSASYRIGGTGDSKADIDRDNLADLWERNKFGNLNQTDTGDWDADGLTNLQEYQSGGDPADVAGLQIFTPLK